MITTSSSAMRLFSLMVRIIGLLVLAAGLQGCGVVRLAYNQAPDALYWWLDSYFDFNEAQTLRLRADLDSLQAWHRQNELPAYAQLLRQVRDMAPGDVQGAQLCELFAQGRSRALAVMERLEPTVVALAPTFTSAQITHLERQLDKRNRKWLDEWLEAPADRLQARRVKEAISRAEHFYGRLDAQQLAAVQTIIARSGFDPRVSYRETLRRQQDALSTLRTLQGAQPAQVRSAMRALFERSLQSPDAAFRSYLDAITREGCDAVAALHNSTTAAQRARAVRTLADYEADLRVLAGRS
jgi:hypothetical protein